MQTTFEIDAISSWLYTGWNMYQAESNQTILDSVRAAMRADMLKLKEFYGLTSLHAGPNVSEHDGDYGQLVFSVEIEVFVQMPGSAEVELDKVPEAMLSPDGGSFLAEFKDSLQSVSNLIHDDVAV